MTRYTSPGMAREANSQPDPAVSLPGDLSRRNFVAAVSAAAVGGISLAQGAAYAAIVRPDLASLAPYGNGTLPPGIRSRKPIIHSAHAGGEHRFGHGTRRAQAGRDSHCRCRRLQPANGRG